MTTVINLFAGPGAGKSTTAAGLFFKMKLAGYNVELVTEFAKDLVWHSREADLDIPGYVGVNQNYRVDKLMGSVDYIVTDSPLLLGLVYNKPGHLTELYTEMFQKQNNFNVFIDRVKPFDTRGRVHTEEESEQIDLKIINIFYSLGMDYIRVDGDATAPDTILKELNREDR